MTGELAAFAAAALCGAGMLLLWDALHGLRRALVRGFVGNFVLDTLWWLVFAWVFLRCMWHTVSLRLRFFEVIALAAGAALYHCTISCAARRVFCGIFVSFVKIIKQFFKILLTPAMFLVKIKKETLKRSKNHEEVDGL